MSGLVTRKSAFTVIGGTAISVATRSAIHKQGYENVNTTGHTSHHVMEVTADAASQIVLPYGFWHWMNNPLPACRLLIDAELVFLEGPSYATTITEIVPVTFNGESTLDVTLDGTSMPKLTSDVIDRTVQRGDLVAVRTYCRAHSGTAQYGLSWYSDTSSGSWALEGNQLGEDNPPVVGGDPGYNNTYYCHPLGLFARSVEQDPLATFYTYGDSNMANSDQFSYHERALAKRFPYYRACTAGGGLPSITNYTHVRELARGYTSAIIAMGTNNLSDNAAVNLARLRTDIAGLRSVGVQRILVCTLPPATSSTDGWTTVENQTPNVEPNLSDYNNGIRAMASSPGGVNADAVFDAISYVGVDADNLFTLNNARWAKRTAPGHVTPGMYGDNVHYGDYGMAAAAVGQAVAIDRLVDGETGFLQQNPDLGA